VLGDSPMLKQRNSIWSKALCVSSGLPVLPFRPTDKIDIVNVDFVAESDCELHQKDRPQLIRIICHPASDRRRFVRYEGIVGGTE